jgi:hypoxanthine-DNA glycosylase
VLSSVTSFPPLSRADAQVLVLGSMPGIASLNAGQYYAHPRNAFWPIMDSLLVPGIGYIPAYEERTGRLLDGRIALWDVLRSCRRPGSLDSSIERGTEIANDFATFFKGHREVGLVIFNGARAEQLFERHAGSLPDDTGSVRMPSTSPAHASMSLDEKLAVWRTCLYTELDIHL